jgi:outer membrane receptor protein involved in Fe transport
MKSLKKLWLLPLLALAGIGLTVAAPAQAQDERADEAIEEIIVTADKRSGKSVQDLAGSITAFDDRKLERLDALDFDDFITQVPGTNFINDGGPGRGNEVASIRGLSAVADNTVGVVAQYLDGAPHFGSSYRFFDIGEVGVLRGPQGTLWGSQSIGGLIYFNSRRPEPSGGLYGNIQADAYTTSGDGGLSQRISGVVNLPVVEDKFAVRAAGHFIDETGYIDNLRTGTQAINDVEESAWRLSAMFNPTDTVSIAAVYHGNDLETDAPTHFAIDLGGLQVDQPSDFGITTQEYDLVNLIVDVDLGWGGLTYNGSAFSNEGGYSDFVDSGAEIQQSTVVVDQESTTHELRLSSRGDNSLQWLVGLYYDDFDDFGESVEVTMVDLDDPAPVEGVRSGGLINRSEKAVFGEVSYDFSERFRLLVGGRWFDWEVDDGTSWTFGGADFGFITNGVADGDEFFYKVSGEFRLSDETLVYASRSEGFRPGGFNTFVGPLWGISPQHYQFEPDTLISYELGAKTSLADNRVTLNAAIYFLDWEEIQAVVQSDTTGIISQGWFTTNAPDLEAKGLELEVVTQDLLAPGFYAALSWAYTDNEFQDDAQLFPGTNVNIRKGDSLRRTPKHTRSLDLGYEFDLTGDISAFLRANYWHKDETTTFGFNGFDGDVRVPAQDVVNFSAGAIWEKFQLKLYVDNVTDSTPWLNVASGGRAGDAGGDQAVTANTLRPRTFGLEGTFYFGDGR